MRRLTRRSCDIGLRQVVIVLAACAVLAPSVVTASAHEAITPAACAPSWTILPSPNPGAAGSSLFGVAAIAPDDVWAVGSSTDTIGGDSSTLAEHWDGTEWTVVPSPNGELGTSRLVAVSALSSSDVWAVGSTGDDQPLQLIEHWDGSTWSVSPPPVPEPWPARLAAVY